VPVLPPQLRDEAATTSVPILPDPFFGSRRSCFYLVETTVAESFSR
jgi:hypothetical protein